MATSRSIGKPLADDVKATYNRVKDMKYRGRTGSGVRSGFWQAARIPVRGGPIRLLMLHFLAAVCTLVLVGCAGSLPNVPSIDQTAKPVTPKIVGPKGTLSEARSRALLHRAEQGSKADRLVSDTVTLMETVSGRPLTAGNKISLLVDGPATYAAMLQAMEAARDHINFETFIFADDEVGKMFAQTFIRKQAEGVQVNLIYDSVGSIDTPASFFGRLRAAGVNVLQYNPVNPLKVRKRLLIRRRDHRKVLVVDGKIGFAGGVNVSSDYYGSSSSVRQSVSSNKGIRDTDVRIEGPAVAELQQSFIDTWRYQNGPALADRDYFPPLERAGNLLAQVIPSYHGERHRLTYVMYLAALRNAQQSIHLTTPYFVPDHRLRKAIAGAARRGVEVRLVLPGFSDSRLAFNAGRSFYQDLFESGVRIYEVRDRMLHAKTVVIDGVWSTVGSTNMDTWSLLYNNEINVIVIGRGFAAEMEEMFEQDLRASYEINSKEWAKRPFSEKIREALAKLFSPFL